MFKKLKSFTLSRLTNPTSNLGGAPTPAHPRQRSLTLSPAHNIYCDAPINHGEISDHGNMNGETIRNGEVMHNSNREALNFPPIHTNSRDNKAHTLDNRHSRPNNTDDSHNKFIPHNKNIRRRPENSIMPTEYNNDEDDSEIVVSTFKNQYFRASAKNTKTPDTSSLGPPLPPRKYSPSRTKNNRIRASTLPLNFPAHQPPLPPRRKQFEGICNSDDANPLQFQPTIELDEGKIMQNIHDLVRHGWYWGPLSKEEAEDKLFGTNDGTFLVRDSSDDRHLLTISFRTSTKTFHTRIEFWKGKFSVFPNCSDDCYESVEQLIDHAMFHCKNGVFFYSRRHEQPSLTLNVCLIKPFSRFLQLRSLQHHCRFVIRQYTRLDLIQSLPLPSRIQEYVSMSIL